MKREVKKDDIVYVVTVNQNGVAHYSPRIVAQANKRGILFQSNSGEGYWKFGVVKCVLGMYKFLDEMDPKQRGDLLADATAKDEAIWRLNEFAEYLPVEKYMKKHRMTLAQLGREMAGKLAVAVNCFPDAERLFDVEVRTRV